MKTALRQTIIKGLFCLALPGLASAQVNPVPRDDQINDLYPGQAYSPVPSALSRATSIGARHTCTRCFRSMRDYLAIRWITRMPIVWRVVRRSCLRPGCR